MYADKTNLGTTPPRTVMRARALAEAATLSAAKCVALTACINGDGTLYKRFGAWSPLPNGPIEEKISGVTVKDLVRDGILKLFVVGTYATARLTEYGEQIARSLPVHRLNDQR
jgi:hypothetical protein